MTDSANLQFKSFRNGALSLVKRLADAGFEAFLVGGSVRDEQLGLIPKDYDIATNAKPEDIEQLFIKTIPVGKQFGVMIVLDLGHEYQIATFRAEADYSDGRHPNTVRFSDAREDALRRDFTINGLFYDPIAETLHDWVGGKNDLELKCIRTIGNPVDRFCEDRLRMLRAVRFAAQLGFEIESETLIAIRENCKLILDVSGERIRDELLKIFKPPYADRGLDLLHESGLLAEVLPELKELIGCKESYGYHPEGDVFSHVRLMLSKLTVTASIELIWSVLMHDLGKPATFSRDGNGQIGFFGHEKKGEDITRRVMSRLRFPKNTIDVVVTCVRSHIQLKDAQNMRIATLRKLFLRHHFMTELELYRIDCLCSSGRLDNFIYIQDQLEAFDSKPEMKESYINGDDLISLGKLPGPNFGRLLKQARDHQLEGEITSRKQALEWLKAQVEEIGTK